MSQHPAFPETTPLALIADGAAATVAAVAPRPGVVERVARLAVGLPLYGFGCALIVEANLGLDPWSVLSQGIARHTGIGMGWITVAVGALLLLAWIPLRQRPGIGTLANVVIVGTVMQVVLDTMPAPEGLPLRAVTFTAGLLSIAVASAVYIGARLGSGPRDGLMMGLNHRLGWPIWVARTSVEGTVLVIGWLLGGSVGFGTLAFALLIGPAVHAAMTLEARLLGRERGVH